MAYVAWHVLELVGWRERYRAVGLVVLGGVKFGDVDDVVVSHRSNGSCLAYPSVSRSEVVICRSIVEVML